MKSHHRQRLLPLHFIFTILLCANRATAQGTSPRIQDGLIETVPSVCPIARDGYTYSDFPWTYNPTCLNTTLNSNNEEAPESHETFCVYTNSNYNNGRGISLVVSPDTAISMIFELYDMAIGGLEGQVGEELGMWEIKNTKDKGKGVFARKDVAGIFAGESIIVKTPVLLVAKQLFEAPPTIQREFLLARAVEQLPDDTKQKIVNLGSTLPGPRVASMVKTNSLEVRWPWVDSVPVLLAVTPEVAGINHACRPNAFWRFHDDSLRYEVVALKGIKPGEEITLSYGFEKRPHRRRTLSIKENFGFTCRCPLCTASEDEIEASNDRLSEIKALKASLPKDHADSPQFLSLLPPLIKQLEEEDLPLDLPMYEEMLAITWSSFGIKDRAKYWAGRAKQHWAVITGKEGWESRRCGDLEADVTGHATWMSWKGDPWEGVGKGHPWDGHEKHDHDEGLQGEAAGEGNDVDVEDLSDYDQRPERDQFRGHI